MSSLITKFIFIFFTFSFAIAEDRIFTEPCEQNSDCVLFEDECHVLNSVLKDKLPKETISWGKDDAKIYSWSPQSKVVCLKSYIVAPSKPKNLVPVCVNNKCSIISKSKKKK